MVKKQGKVRSVPITEIVEGMQALHKGAICKITGTGIVKRTVCLKTPLGDQIAVYDDQIRTLVVEHEESEYIRGLNRAIREVKQLPLKYSQWSAAISNGEVDSDKQVEFEIIKRHTDDTLRVYESIAKIIPAKKKMYTEDEVIDFVNWYVKLHGLGTRYLLENRTLLNDWWEKNK